MITLPSSGAGHIQSSDGVEVSGVDPLPSPSVEGALAHPAVEWLFRTTTRLLQCHDIAALLDLAYEAIRQDMGYDRVGLLLLDDARHAMVERISTDEHGQRFYPEGRVFRLGSGHYTEAVLTDPRMIPGGPGFMILRGEHYLRSALRQKNLDGQPRELLRVALRTAERVIGYVSVDNLISDRPIVETDIPQLIAFADALTIAIEMVSQREARTRQIHDLNSRLSYRVEQLTWLQNAAVQIALPRTLDELCDTVYSCLRDGLNYDRAGIVMLERAKDGGFYELELRGTDEHGNPLIGNKEPHYLDGSNLESNAPDVHYLLQGHAYYYCPDRWAITLPEHRFWLDGHMKEQLTAALRNSDGELIGYISVDNLVSGRPILLDDAQPLVTFAAQAALALARARLWDNHLTQGEGLRQRLAELEWLSQVGARINAAKSLAETLDVVYDGIRDLGYDRVGINLFDYDTGLYQDVIGTDSVGQKIANPNRQVSLALDSFIWRDPCTAAILRGEVLYHNTDVVGTSPPELLPLYDGLPRESLAVALRSGKRIIGNISVDNLISGRPLVPDDAGPLLLLANHVGTALENARLQERERAERARLAVLLESTRALNSSLDRQHILFELAQNLVAAIGATRASFLEANLDARTVTAILHYTIPGRPTVFVDQETSPLDALPVIDDLLRTRQPFVGRVDDPACPGPEQRFLLRHGLYAEVVFPVVSGGVTIGLMGIFWDEPADISNDTLGLCAAIADGAGIALHNARLYSEAAHRADHDQLTGLLNHRAMLDAIDAVVTPANLTHPTFSCALLLIDVDNFKLFNDVYGHPTGDAVLVQVAALLRDTCRADDLAGRFGGDEFALFLPNATPAQAQSVAVRLSAALAIQPHTAPDGSQIPLHISIGVAIAPIDGHTRKELVVVADRRMYDQKHGVSAPHASPPDPVVPLIAAPTSQEGLLAPIPLLRRRAADLLGDSPFGVLEGLVMAVDAKDHYTRLHSDDVGRLALNIADSMGISAEEHRVLSLAAPLHDVGKIAIPDRVLRKPGKLTAAEYSLMKEHVRYGVAIIRGVLDDPDVLTAVLAHHERWDGRGYPNGTRGPETSLVGRIMQVADALSAMMLDRPYRKGLSWDEARAELERGAGTQFDPEIARRILLWH